MAPRNCPVTAVFLGLRAEGTVKLLLFSDLHADGDAARRLVGRAASVDVLVGAGDFSNFRRDTHVCIDILKDAGRPLVLVAGNHESTEELTETCQRWSGLHVLHGTAVTIAGVTFFGLPGAVPATPFGAWSYDFSEEQAEAMLADCPAGCVLVSHSPPKGTVDRSSRGQSLGSTAVRDAIGRLRPLLVACGHIHDSAGQTGKVGGTLVVNCGPGGIDREVAVPA
jgi:Icc-related predicted phosphoesterase